MNAAQQEISRFSAATKEMKTLTKPLLKQGILHFSMIRSYDDGRFANLSNIDGWVDYYYQQRLYMSSCFENHPSQYFSQVFLWHDKLEGNVIFDAKKHFDSSHGVTIIDRNYNYTSFYFFSSSLDHTYMDNFYINNLEFLHQFIHQFENEAKKLIHDSLSDKRRFIYDALYVDNPLPDNIRQVDKLDLKRLRKLQQDSEKKSPHITPKESECLSCLLRGMSVKEIASLKSMSPRTVEHHINSLKTKFNCSTTLALVSNIYSDHHHMALSLLHATYT